LLSSKIVKGEIPIKYAILNFLYPDELNDTWKFEGIPWAISALAAGRNEQRFT
jgi:hypothetical protein